MADGWVALYGGFPMNAWHVDLIWEPAEIRTMKRRWREHRQAGVGDLAGWPALPSPGACRRPLPPTRRRGDRSGGSR